MGIEQRNHPLHIVPPAEELDRRGNFESLRHLLNRVAVGGRSPTITSCRSSPWRSSLRVTRNAASCPFWWIGLSPPCRAGNGRSALGPAELRPIAPRRKRRQALGGRVNDVRRGEAVAFDDLLRAGLGNNHQPVERRIRLRTGNPQPSQLSPMTLGCWLRRSIPHTGGRGTDRAAASSTAAPFDGGQVHQNESGLVVAIIPASPPAPAARDAGSGWPASPR